MNYDETRILFIKFGEALAEATRKIAELLIEWFNTLDPYIQQEMLHPKKKPRGSIRRARKGQKVRDKE